MDDYSMLLLAVALIINGFLAWSAGRTAWNSTRIANRIDEKTDKLLAHAELTQEPLIELLRAAKKA